MVNKPRTPGNCWRFPGQFPPPLRPPTQMVQGVVAPLATQLPSCLIVELKDYHHK